MKLWLTASLIYAQERRIPQPISENYWVTSFSVLGSVDLGYVMEPAIYSIRLYRSDAIFFESRDRGRFGT